MGVVTGDVLNVRFGPSVSDSIVAKARQGTKLHILEGPKDGWYKVRTDKDTVGWVHGDYLKIQTEDEKRAEAETFINRKSKDLDSETRDRVRVGLRQLGVAPLIALLKDESWEVRRGAAVLLGHSGYRRAVDPLVACLKDEAREVRISAAWALEQLRYKPATEQARIAFVAAKRDREQLAQETAAAVEPLIACLKDENARLSAAAALGKIGDGQTAGVGYYAAEALGKLGDGRAVAPLVALLKEDHSPAAHALGVLGDARAVEPLITCLKGEGSGEFSAVHYWAAWALGKLGDARAVEPLIACLKDDHERGSAAGALGMLGDARAVEPLIACLKDENESMREVAAEALGNLGDARAVKPLIACLNDKEDKDPYSYPDVRGSAAIALEKLGDAAVEPLIACLKDEDSDVRRRAAEVLGNLGDARGVVPNLCRQFGDEREGLRFMVARALGLLGDARAVEALLAQLEDKYEDCRILESVARALERLGYKPATAEARVTFLLAKRDWKQLVQKVPAAVETLIACLKDDKRWVRQSAAEALGVLGDERALEPLAVLQKDDYDDVREAVSEALGRLRHAENVVKLGPSLIESSIAILRDQARNNNQRLYPEGGRPYNEISERLWRLGEAALAPLIAWLKDEHLGVRATAAEALGKMGDTRAVEALITCLKDESEWVREAAAEALGRLAYPPDRARFYDLEVEEDPC
ncbi:MAG: HEAT repeat domain-containing protein [Candidatus Hydrogenedentes bacterium]|nr:HEAT repeat domain-containing protein [Candidatus Hydrogenedentota bacterium]